MTELFAASTVGMTCEGSPFVVEKERIAAYAAATNDTSRPEIVQGDLAPPVFSFVPMRTAFRPLLKKVTPLYEALKGLHGEQDMLFEAPLRPGMVVRPRASVLGIRPRSTGTAVVVRAETRGVEDRQLVNNQYLTLFYPGAHFGETLGDEAPDHRMPAFVAGRTPDARVAQRIDPDQPARYAAASGDTGGYHLDETAALEAGLPGIIVHGMCSLAFAARAVLVHVVDGDVRRLRRLAVRFSKPVRPCDTITTAIWRADDGRTYAFRTVDSAGDVVLDHGRVELT
jgi:acyl dehydratase